MTGKSASVAARVSGLGYEGWDARYVGWFDCFNQGLYYEAHDVLEDLWLEQGKAGANHAFFKGLIQLAGAFVHLQKDRLGPSVALFRLAEANLRSYPHVHEGIDLRDLLALADRWRELAADPASGNPIRRMAPPRVTLPRRDGPTADRASSRGCAA